MQQKGEQFAIKWPLLPTKGQIYAAAALIIFLPKRCQLIWSNFRSMMTSSKAQQCAKLPAWMFGGPYFASGRGKRQTFWAGAGGQYLRGRPVIC